MKRLTMSKQWSTAAAISVLAAAGMVLARAPGAERVPHLPSPHAPPASGGTRATFSGPSVHGRLAISQSAFGPQTRRALAELRIEAEDGPIAGASQPVALAIVLDTSGSMTGTKLEQAKSALRQLVQRMGDEDEVAIITYDHEAHILQGRARVGSMRSEIDHLVSQIRAGGGTSIPPALTLAAQTLEGAAASRIRRVVLLSDGRDGSGVSVEQMSENVRRQAQGGVSTSSLGIGLDYDERFMTSVANAGRGNYLFLADGSRLNTFLQAELEAATRTLLAGMQADVLLPMGAVVRDVYGADHERQGNRLTLHFGPIASGESRRATIDFDVPAGESGELSTSLRYRTARDGAEHRLTAGMLSLRNVSDDALARESIDEEVYGDTWALAVDQAQAEAIDRWRQGDVQGARRIAAQNSDALREVQRQAPSSAAAAEVADELAADTEMLDRPAASPVGRAESLGSNARRYQRAMH